MPTECTLAEFAKAHQSELIWFGIALLFVFAAVIICTAVCTSRKPKSVLNPAVPKVLDVIVHICEGYQHAGDPATKEMTNQIIAQARIMSDLLDIKLKSL